MKKAFISFAEAGVIAVADRDSWPAATRKKRRLLQGQIQVMLDKKYSGLPDKKLVVNKDK